MFSDLTEKMAEDIKTFDKITMIFNKVLPKIYELERTGKLPPEGQAPSNSLFVSGIF